MDFIVYLRMNPIVTVNCSLCRTETERPKFFFFTFCLLYKILDGMDEMDERLMDQDLNPKPLINVQKVSLYN